MRSWGEHNVSPSPRRTSGAGTDAGTGANLERKACPAVTYPLNAMREACLLVVALSVAGCGGKLAPLPPPTPDGPPSPVQIPLPEASTSDAVPDSSVASVPGDGAPSVALDDAEITCELENAPGISLEEYGNRLCVALAACAGGGASLSGGSNPGSVTGPGGSGCTALIVSRANTEQVRAACLNACALYLQSIQQGGPACEALLEGGPPECTWAVEATYIYCSRSHGRLSPADAVGQSDGAWCPSDEQCVTVVPPGCSPDPEPGTLLSPACASAANEWTCLN